MPTTWHVPQPPYRSRLRGGDESLAVSRRLSNPDGSFAGVVVGTLRLAYFRDRFAGLSIGERDVITVFRNDGAVLARDPYSMSDLGDDFAMSPAFQQFLIRREGAFVACCRQTACVASIHSTVWKARPWWSPWRWPWTRCCSPGCAG